MCFSKISGFNSQPQSRQLSLGKLIYTALYIISISNPLATWWEEATHWKRPWFRGRLRAEGEVGNRGWDGWMALLTRWTWVWANSGRWWRTRKPRMLQSMGLQRTRLDLMKWSELKVAQLCLTLCNPKDCTVHGILQTRILECVAFYFSRGSSQPRDRTQVSLIAGGFFTSWATRKDP